MTRFEASMEVFSHLRQLSGILPDELAMQLENAGLDKMNAAKHSDLLKRGFSVGDRVWCFYRPIGEWYRGVT